MTQLPANFAKIAQHFSAEVQVAYTNENIDQIEDVFAEEYKSTDGGEFLFYYTKTRTLTELYNTSYDPGNIDKLVKEFQDSKLFLDYNTMSYDLYEDANNGIVVAIPAGQQFVYYDEGNYFYRFIIREHLAFLGVGASSPSGANLPNEISEADFERYLAETIQGLDRPFQKILVCHQPPIDTLCDRTWNNSHVGSKAVRTFIERVQPIVCFTGHIHEGCNLM